MERVVVLTTGLGCLAATYVLLIVALLGSTLRTLVPWDTWGWSIPPQGTWQRELNDFFKQAPGLYLPTLVVLGISIYLFIRGMLRYRPLGTNGWLPFAFAALNLAAILAWLPIITLAGRLPELWLPQPRHEDIGYHRTWPDLLASSILMGMLLWSQSWVASPACWERLPVHTPKGQRLTILLLLLAAILLLLIINDILIN